MKSKFLTAVAAVAIAIVAASSVQAGEVVTVWDDLFLETLGTTVADPATNTQGLAPDVSWQSATPLPAGPGWLHTSTLNIGVSVQISGVLWANAADFVNDVTVFMGSPAELLDAPVNESLGSDPPVGVPVTGSDVTIWVDENGFGNMQLANVKFGTLAQFGDQPITGLRVGIVGIGGNVTTPGNIRVVSTPEPTSGLFLASLAAGTGAVVRRRRK